MTNQTEPKAGEFYRHFKNRLYQVMGVAFDSETEEKMVVYQALYGDFRLWVRPLSEFMSEVDHVRYPGVTQQYRFVRVVPKPSKEPGPEEETVPTITGGQESGSGNPVLDDFLDAKDREEKKGILTKYADRFTQKDMDSIYTVFGITGFGGSVKQQTEGLVRYLDMQEQYEGDHLRGGNTSCSKSGKN